ncbi:ParB/RepB/Spo0J family partition protein [Sulfurimonas sp. MAG313]|nr:ParB/RepB/Spo0J family partition protein [Sulfurimonas sp. MAG313]MDF1880513.1 ParB/RepB/Spo0J family partition protein [Sulfurimonas sp. MAG313]
MSGKTQALGRGLGELLGEIEEAYDNEISPSKDLLEIPLNNINVNPFQPRKHFDEKALSELCESIKRHGLLQPIVVVEEMDSYILIAGERRFRASKMAKTKTIKAVVVSASSEQMRELALIENIQREELNAMELAKSYEELILVHEITQEELSGLIYKSRSSITNTLRLLQLSTKAQRAIVDKTISAGHAKVMVNLSAKDQNVLVDSIIGQKLSVREVEKMVKQFKGSNSSVTNVKPLKKPSLDMSILVNALDEHLINYELKDNKISFSFSNEEEIATFSKFFS